MPTTRRAEPRNTTVIFTYEVTIPTATDFIAISNNNPILPGTLLDYYNRRCTLQLAAEVFNGDVALVALDTAGTPNPIMLDDVQYPPDAFAPQPYIPHRVICALSNADPLIRRLVSPANDVSTLYRTGQHQVFGILGRRIEASVVTLIRNVTVIAYLGELPGPVPDKGYVNRARWPQMVPEP